MAICGCKSRKRRGRNLPAASISGQSGELAKYEENLEAVKAVILEPEEGDALIQTIGVSKTEFDRRKSTIKRVFSVRAGSISDVEPEPETRGPSIVPQTEEKKDVEEIEQAEDRAAVIVEPQPIIQDVSLPTEVQPKELSPPEAKEEPHAVQPGTVNALAKAAEEADAELQEQNRRLRINEPQRPHIANVAEAVTQPLAEASTLPIKREQFLNGWMDVLDLCRKDVGTWMQEEALIKAHILGRLIRVDCEKANAVLEGAERGAVDQITASQSCILPVDGNLPFLETLIPPEVLVEIGGGADILMDVKQHASEAQLKQLKQKLNSLLVFCHSREMQHMQERWNCFGDVIAIFDLNQRVSFDLTPVSLMKPSTLQKWNELINPFGGTISEDALRVETAPSDRPEQDARKRGLRRSLTKQLKKVGRVVKYRKAHSHAKAGKDEPWITDDKPQLSLAYRLHADGNVSVKVRCKLPVSFLNMVLVLDDVASFNKWLPYCSEVNQLGRYGTASYLLSYIADMPWPIRKRETVVYCEGLDCLDETGQIIVVVKNPPLTPGKNGVFEDPMPPPLPKIPRIPKSAMAFFVRPLEAEVTAVELFARLDPGMSVKILKGIIPWIVKNTVVDFMVKIANLARNLNVERMMASDQNPQFYELLRTRGRQYLEKLRSREAPAAPPPAPGKANKGFDDNDPQWYDTLPVLAL